MKSSPPPSASDAPPISAESSQKPIKVLHVGSELSWRGGESQIGLLTGALARAGVENHVAYPVGSVAVEKFAGRFPVLALKSRQSWDPRVVRQLARYCETQRIDIFDAHSARSHALGILVKKSLPQVKLVVHRHVDNPIGRSFFTRRKYLSPLVDGYIAISSAIAKILGDYGVAKEKIAVAKSATDTDAFELTSQESREQFRGELLAKLPKTRTQAPLSPALIGNASALTSQKGYEVLIDALALLRDRSIDYHCFIAGDGVLKPKLKAQAAALGLADKITFLGFLTDVRSFLLGLDILCVPSNNEGLGTVILEGILAGCAVAATAVGGIPEMIIDNQTGLLSERGNVPQLAQNLELLIKDPHLRFDLNKRAQIKVRAEFGLDSLVNGNLQLYRRLLSADGTQKGT